MNVIKHSWAPAFRLCGLGKYLRGSRKRLETHKANTPEGRKSLGTHLSRVCRVLSLSPSHLPARPPVASPRPFTSSLPSRASLLIRRGTPIEAWGWWAVVQAWRLISPSGWNMPRPDTRPTPRKTLEINYIFFAIRGPRKQRKKKRSPNASPSSPPLHPLHSSAALR